jgi:aminocarboxymuconate-semialdehyde decarboxylase
MTRDAGEKATIRRGDQFYRAIDARCWDIDRRLTEMDATGVAMQVISPTPVTYAYEAPAAHVAGFVRAHNEGIAKLVRARPDRFAGLGAVALQDVDAACAEVERAMGELGLAGIEIGTLVGDVALDDARFAALWATCERTGAIVFVHPESTLAPQRFAKHRMVFSAGYPSETGVTVSALLLDGLFERFPRLKMLLAHGGGTLPWLLPRLDRVWSTMPDARSGSAIRPFESARSLWVDTLVFDPANAALLVERFGREHLVLGSDFPFGIGESPPGAFVPAEILHVTRANALRLLER